MVEVEVVVVAGVVEPAGVPAFDVVEEEGAAEVDVVRDMLAVVGGGSVGGR